MENQLEGWKIAIVNVVRFMMYLCGELTSIDIIRSNYAMSQ